MLTADEIKNIPLNEIRHQIANTLSAISANDLAEVCTNFGLAAGTTSDAWEGKYKYVEKRLRSLSKDDLIQLGTRILQSYDSIKLADLISELTIHAELRISTITRKNILLCIDNLDVLFGELELAECLRIINPDLHDPYPNLFLNNIFGITDNDPIYENYINKKIWPHSKLLTECHALTCTQERFFKLLEKLLDPLVRQGDEQSCLANELDKLLRVDGFSIEVERQISGHPVYAVRALSSGVAGKPKNLIFASIEKKPDLYLTNSIDNDVAIHGESDALIYDRPLSDQGLLWSELADWWKEINSQRTISKPKSDLYRRLNRSVIKTESRGEIAIFQTYYQVFMERLEDKLPALIPQVYLHYDPRTLKERKGRPVLPRQRMDFL